jgi:hypothetical protein
MILKNRKKDKAKKKKKTIRHLSIFKEPSIGIIFQSRILNKNKQKEEVWL